MSAKGFFFFGNCTGVRGAPANGTFRVGEVDENVSPRCEKVSRKRGGYLGIWEIRGKSIKQEKERKGGILFTSKKQKSREK